MTEYFEDGIISARGESHSGKLVEVTEYFHSGKIHLIKYYDRNGEILNIRKFFEDGSIDYKAFPFIYTIPFRDTIRYGMNSILKARIVNVYDSIYLNGKLFITSRLDTAGKSKIIQIKDTISIIEPANRFEFIYNFKPRKLGNDTIRGQFLFTKETDDEITFSSELFAYPIFVKE